VEHTRLKVRIGENEFDAEGPPEQITAQFAAWKDLLTLVGHNGRPASTTNPKAGKPAIPQQSLLDDSGSAIDDPPSDRSASIFHVDEKRQLVTLRVLPPNGEDRDADAALLTIYGFKTMLNAGEVLVGRLKDALQASGLTPTRIDKIVLAYTTNGLVLKVGRGPGGKYHLSNTGRAKAEALAKKLTEQLA
jgi:hypothetical protein